MGDCHGSRVLAPVWLMVRFPTRTLRETSITFLGFTHGPAIGVILSEHMRHSILWQMVVGCISWNDTPYGLKVWVEKAVQLVRLRIREVRTNRENSRGLSKRQQSEKYELAK